ncbi:MAG: chemoreceptor glutamine deamidase CheD [Pseudomonadota bacterium]
MSFAGSDPRLLSKGGYWDPKIGAPAHTVLPGDHLVIDEPGVAVTTLLGSCVAACLRDREMGLGGLNHFLLPGTARGQQSMRYGVHAMEVLINDILKRGGRKSRIEAKVFGGGNVIAVSGGDTVGDRNARFVQDFLKSEGIRVEASDLGGDHARRVYYFPDTGRASVLKLMGRETGDLRSSEQRLRSQVESKPTTGTVELFG